MVQQADVVSDLYVDNSICSDENLETNVPETKIREGRISSCKLEKSGEDKDGLDKVHLNCSQLRRKMLFFVQFIITIEASYKSEAGRQNQLSNKQRTGW